MQLHTAAQELGRDISEETPERWAAAAYVFETGPGRGVGESVNLAWSVWAAGALNKP